MTRHGAGGLVAFGRFAATARWRFAKTYIDSYPHEYTLDEWCEEEEFRKAIECIEAFGNRERFWDAERKYLYFEDRVYWHMGDPSSNDIEGQPGLINRSWVDLSRHREDAKRLGYGGETLDALVVRWRDLLAKAKRPKD